MSGRCLLLGMFKLSLRTVSLWCGLVLMPTPMIGTVMLQELTEHHHMSQCQRFWKCITSVLSNVSSSGTSTSDLVSEVSDLMLINMPDINVSSNISIHSNGPLPTSSSDSDSLCSILDFEVEYYKNWEQCYRELWDKISTTCVLNPGPPIPKSSQFHLLDHWRIHNPECFCHKLCVEPQTFDCLVNCIKDHPIFHNNSNNSQLPVHIQLSIFLFCAGHYGNASSPEDTAQWARVSIGGVEKCTDWVIVALLSSHDEAIHLPDAIKKESSKSYVDKAVCLEWFSVSQWVEIPILSTSRVAWWCMVW